MEFVYTLAIIFSVFGISFLLMNIKGVVKGKAEFSGTCASNNPALRNELGECGFCGKKDTECENKVVAG